MGKEEHPLVSIITVNYNQADVTCAMLESLKRSAYQNIEVIVVDNASKENPTAKINAVYHAAQIILSKENLGFAGGNNLGIQAAKGAYLFFVNNDTELTPDLIQNLLEPFSRIQQLGVACPKIYYYDHPEMIQYAGYTPINPFTARNSTIGQFETDKGQHNTEKPTPYAHGAAMLLSRKALEKAGMMPDFYFLYYEELDWCEQIRKAGFEIYYVPKATIYHKESVSVGKMSPLKIYYITRNRILFMRRNAKPLHLAMFTLFLFFFTIPKNMLLYLIKREFNLAKSFLRGVAWNLSNKAPAS